MRNAGRQQSKGASSSKLQPEWLAGLDIGGTKIEVLIVDGELNQKARVRRPTDTRSTSHLLESINLAYCEALQKADGPNQPVSRVGLAVPGLVDPETGQVHLAVNLNLDSYALGEALSAEFGVPTVLENDVRAAAVGSHYYIRQNESLQHLAYLSIGTGIAAGLILNGRLFRGANGMAGEIGHIIVEPGGFRCGCGAYGCLEAMAAGPAVARFGREILAPTQGDGPITAEAVYRAASEGEPEAQEIIRRVSGYLSWAIQLLIMTYDVEKVVLGGGVTRSGAAFLNPILKEMAKLRSSTALAKTMLPDSKIALLPAGYNAGVWGAILLAQQAALDNA